MGRAILFYGHNIELERLRLSYQPEVGALVRESADDHHGSALEMRFCSGSTSSVREPTSTTSSECLGLGVIMSRIEDQLTAHYHRLARYSLASTIV
jgi:hypothetical protein